MQKTVVILHGSADPVRAERVLETARLVESELSFFGEEQWSGFVRETFGQDLMAPTQGSADPEGLSWQQLAAEAVLTHRTGPLLVLDPFYSFLPRFARRLQVDANLSNPTVGTLSVRAGQLVDERNFPHLGDLQYARLLHRSSTFRADNFRPGTAAAVLVTEAGLHAMKEVKPAPGLTLESLQMTLGAQGVVNITSASTEAFSYADGTAAAGAPAGGSLQYGKYPVEALLERVGKKRILVVSTPGTSEADTDFAKDLSSGVGPSAEVALIRADADDSSFFELSGRVVRSATPGGLWEFKSRSHPGLLELLLSCGADADVIHIVDFDLDVLRASVEAAVLLRVPVVLDFAALYSGYPLMSEEAVEESTPARLYRRLFHRDTVPADRGAEFPEELLRFLGHNLTSVLVDEQSMPALDPDELLPQSTLIGVSLGRFGLPMPRPAASLLTENERILTLTCAEGNPHEDEEPETRIRWVVSPESLREDEFERELIDFDPTTVLFTPELLAKSYANAVLRFMYVGARAAWSVDGDGDSADDSPASRELQNWLDRPRYVHGQEYRRLYDRLVEESVTDAQPVNIGYVIRGGSPGSHTGSGHIRVARLARWFDDDPTVNFHLVDPASFICGRYSIAFDSMLVLRNTIPTELVSDFIAACREGDTRIVVDIDDDLFSDIDTAGRSKIDIVDADKLAMRELLRESALTLCSTPVIEQRVAAFSKSTVVVENRLDTFLWRELPVPQQKIVSADPIRVLYMGTATHSADLALLKEVFSTPLMVGGKRVVLEIVGITQDQDRWYQSLDVPPAARNYPGFVKWLRSKSSRWYCAIAPLEDSAFNLAKSDLKLLEYGALGLPAIASNVGPYVNHPGARRLVPNQPAAWRTAIKEVVQAEHNGFVDGINPLRPFRALPNRWADRAFVDGWRDLLLANPADAE